MGVLTIEYFTVAAGTEPRNRYLEDRGWAVTVLSDGGLSRKEK